MEIGTRVIAILSCGNGVVKSFGEGVYAGHFCVDEKAGGFNFGQDNPRIDLDNGKTVWGCECWWGRKERVLAEYPPSRFIWETVDIDEYRGANKT